MYFPGAANGHGVVKYYEWKMATLSGAWYPVTRDSGSNRRWGAEGRAATLRTEYDGRRGDAGSGDGAARRADRTVNPGLAEGVVGSIQARWRRLGGVTPLAVGSVRGRTLLCRGPRVDLT